MIPVLLFLSPGMQHFYFSKMKQFHLPRTIGFYSGCISTLLVLLIFFFPPVYFLSCSDGFPPLQDSPYVDVDKSKCMDAGTKKDGLYRDVAGKWRIGCISFMTLPPN